MIKTSIYSESSQYPHMIFTKLKPIDASRNAASILAGMLLALGYFASFIVKNDSMLAPGFASILSGFIFASSFVIVSLINGQHVTSNELLWIGIQRGDYSIKKVLSLLVHDWMYNFIGAALISVCVKYSGFNYLLLGALINTKCPISVDGCVRLVAKGIGGGFLVCIGEWISLGSNDIFKKVISILIPTSILTVCGFELIVTYMFMYGFASVSLIDTSLLILCVTGGNLIGGLLCSLAVYYSDRLYDMD